MKILCVAEKPSAAKSLASILSNNRFVTRNGVNKYCKNYDFQYKWQGQMCDMVMTSLLGHLMSIDFDEQSRNWQSCPPLQLFDNPIVKKVSSDMTQVSQNLERECRNADILVIWTDCDREGENIGDEVAKLCLGKNRRLIVKRARFSSITPTDINRACQNLVALDQCQVQAVDARMELDLRIGAAFTRFQTLKFTNMFSELKGKLISYGPCQFPTLGFVVDQYLKVEKFIPEPFWFIDMEMTKQDNKTKFLWNRGKLFDRAGCFLIYEACLENPVATITSLEAKPTTKWKPLPLTTVELQKAGSRILKMSSDKTMQIAETLYQRGLISYPRTETDIFSENFEFMPLIQAQAGHPTWGQYAQRLLDGEFRKPRKGKNDDKAHPPIHPTGAAIDLNGDEKRIYEYVTRRFLACCSENAKGHETIVTAEITSEVFTAKGLMIIERNYLEIFTYDKWSESSIPHVEKGEQFLPSSFMMKEGETSPPKLLSEADLISIMDKNGIGTDATIHEHIKKIIERQYVFKDEKGFFIPSTLGVALVEGYDAIGFEKSLSKPLLRSEMENNLKRICAGEISKIVVLSTSVNMYRDVFQQAMNSVNKIAEALQKYLGHPPEAEGPNVMDFNSDIRIIRKCPKCSSAMVVRRKKDAGWFIGCRGFPSCRETISLPPDIKEIVITDEVCSICSKENDRIQKLMFSFNNNIPNSTNEYLGCIGGCDQFLKDMTCQTYNNRGLSLNTLEAPRESSTSFSEEISIGQPPSTVMRSNSNATIPKIHRPQNHEAVQINECFPLCKCGIQSILRKTVKEGINFGREFFCCGKPRDQQCGYFEWKEGASTHSSTSTFQLAVGNLNPSTPECNCGEPSVLKTVQRESANKGKQFYCCQKPRETQCDYFSWKDDGGVNPSFGNQGAKQQSYNNQHTDPSIYNSQFDISRFNDQNTLSHSSNSKPKCHCDLYCTLKQVFKDGPNKGRNFYCCSKASNSSKCNFFLWEDGDQSNPSSASASTRSHREQPYQKERKKRRKNLN